jgi:TolB-like protein
MSTDDSNNALEFVTTEELIVELMRRHDAIVIARETHTTDAKNDATFDFSGGLSAALGLVERLKRRLLKAAEAGEVAEDEAET